MVQRLHVHMDRWGLGVSVRRDRPLLPKVVSWSLMKRHTCALVCEAFRKAFWRRGAPKGLTFHSDRGGEYSSSEFRRLLDSCSVVQSFSAPGCPYDNSVCESFFKYLKKEETDRYRYRTFEQLRASILGYIDGS